MAGPFAPGYAFWIEILVAGAAGSTLIVGLAALVAYPLRVPIWHRTIWQAAIAALLVLVPLECIGLGAGAASLIRLYDSRNEETPPPALASAAPGASSTTGPSSHADELRG